MFHYKQFSFASVQFFCLHSVKCKDSSMLNNSVLNTYTVLMLKQFYFKQFSLAYVQFLFTQSMAKSVLFQKIQFSIRTQFRCQNNPILNNLV